MKNFLLALSIGLLVVATVWLALQVTVAIDSRVESLEGPDADKPVVYRGIYMRNGDFLLHHLIEEQAPTRAILLRIHSAHLRFLLYALLGMIGNYFYYLHRIVDGKRSRSPGIKTAERFLARTLIGALCGIVCLLIVNLLASPIGQVIGVPELNQSPEQAARSVKDGFLFLPFAAGTFVVKFYEHMEHLFDAIMGRVRQLVAGE